MKAVAIGRPLASEEEIGERLSKPKALAVFSSDAISSSAYASEEILRILVLAGGAAVVWSVPIALAIAGLLVIVTTSYRQVCHAYPSGGGAYAVARANLGVPVALLAAAALLFDYMMTVAVSIAAGIAAITSVVPELLPYRTELSILATILLAVANLRGLRESGNLFAVPTYAYVVGALALIGIGVARIVTGDPAATFPIPERGAARGRLRGPVRDPHRPGVRLRLGGAQRDGGDHERRARLQATRGAQCREHDDRDGAPARDDLRWRVRPRLRVRHRPGPGARRSPSSPRSRSRSSGTGWPSCSSRR